MKKRFQWNSVSVRTGRITFIAIGLFQAVLIAFYILSSYNYLLEFLQMGNNDRLNSIIRTFDHNLEEYLLDLEQRATDTIYTKAVMNPQSTEYYLADYMDRLGIRNLNGYFTLVTFDGKIIYSTDPILENQKEHGTIHKVIELADKEETINFYPDGDVYFTAPILYNGFTEGYLIFVCPFYKIYEANLLEQDSLSTFSVLYKEHYIINKLDEEKTYRSIYPLSTLPLSIMASTPYSIIREPLFSLIRRILPIALIMLFSISLILAILISHNIVRPLQILQHGIEKVTSGSWESLKGSKSSPTEINFLTQSFNTMQDSLIKKSKELNNLNQDLIKAMEDLKETQTRMIQSEKMASIGLLAAGVAHEINNPTGYITTNIITMMEYVEVFSSIFNELEKLEKAVNEERIEVAQSIVKDIIQIKEQEDLPFLIEDSTILLQESREGARRIKDIVQSLRVYAHTEKSFEQKNSINDTIDDALKLTHNVTKYNCEILREYSQLPEIYCHSDQLTQVFINLIVNAAHAIENNGIIKFQTYVKDNKVVVKICDNGKGISEEHLIRLFDPFFTTKDIGKGTGLGLTISQNIIKSHNGSIDVESTEGEGTCFTIKLPIGMEENPS